MRVVQCIHGLGSGGAQQVVREIVSLSDQSIEHLVYAAEDGLFRGPLEDAGARVRILPRRVARFDPTWLMALARRMKADRVDLVHTHLFGDSLHGFLAARWAGGLPVMMTLHCDFGQQPWLQRRGYAWLLSRVEQAVACSEFVRGSFRAVADRAGGTIRTIVNGIGSPAPPGSRDEARKLLNEALGVSADATVIASIGRLAVQKGPEYLLEALARLSGVDSRGNVLLFLGDGELRVGLETRAREFGVRDRVVFAGERSDISALLPGVDVVVFSSVWEGLSIAMLEAMACARCIVATDVAGIREAVRDGHEAVMVPVRDSGALAQALARVVGSPQLRNRLGSAARRRYLERFTADRMVREYQELYEELISVARAGAAWGVNEWKPRVKGP